MNLFKHVWGQFNTLVEGSSALKLNPIPVLKSFKITPETRSVPFGAKVQELFEKTYEAACLLNTHYDRVADSNAGFIPYWNGDKTFVEENNSFPEVDKRRFFESYEKFFERNDLEGRIVVDTQLNHLSPFFYEEKPILTPGYVKREIKKYAEVVVGTSFSAAFTACSALMIALTVSEPNLGLKESIIGGITTSISLGAQVFTDYKIKQRERKAFTDVIVGNYLNRNARIADETISLIKTLAE